MKIKIFRFIFLSISLLPFLSIMSCKKDNDIDFPTQIIVDCDNFDVILVAGQSNTNSGLYYDPTKDTSDYRIKQLGRFGNDDYKIIEGKEPLQSWDHFADRIGFSVTFAQEYIKNGLLEENRKILLIPCGQGGTGFNSHDWNRGDLLYVDAISRTNSVLTSGTNNRLVTILWHQGENDCGMLDKDYRYSLDNMISLMRRDILTNSITPFIVGGMVPAWINYYKQYEPKQEIIANTVYRLPYIGYANPMVPFELKPNDTVHGLEGYIHYDAENQREFGKRYFHEYTLLLDRIAKNNEYLIGH